MADPAALDYHPNAMGRPDARAAIASSAGSDVTADQIVLTSSTSEAYSWLFKLLCDPGDDVLVPNPSYPLFELLTGLEAVRTVPYRLEAHNGWALDRASLIAALGPRTRAVLVVSPNNPTGSLVHDDDREWLIDLAADRHCAVIADEVFWPYRWQPAASAHSFAGESRALVFTLGGLSKSIGLPQMKLGWIVASGPDERLREACARLEIIADTYLSVSTPVQVAAAKLLAIGGDVQRQISERVLANLACLRLAVARHPELSLVEPEGGWSAVVRVPAIASEETLVLRALREAEVVVHPGYFFDFPEGRFLVVSLLPRPREFREGVDRLFAVINEMAHG